MIKPTAEFLLFGRLYLFLEYAPPYCVIINFASAGLGFLILTGYCSCFSYTNID